MNMLKFRVLLFLGFFLFFSTACEKDFFELQYPPEEAWLSITELEQAAVSPYNFAFYDIGGGGWGDPVFQDRLNRFIMSDLPHFLGNTEAYQHETFLNRATGTYLPIIEDSYTKSYQIIGSANAVLDFFYSNDKDPLPDISPSDRENNLHRIVGEMHFMRAFGYFMLVKRHSPNFFDPESSTKEVLTYRTSFPKNNEEAVKLELATTKQIYELIIDDLKEAKKLLPESYLAGKHHASYQFGRANKFAASALLARVFFQKGDHDKAIDELDYVIEEGNFSLEDNPIDAFNKSSLDPSPEVIWFALYSDQSMYDYSATPLTTKRPTQMNKTHYIAANGGRDANWSLCPWVQFALSYDALGEIGWMRDPVNGDYTETDTARWDKRYNQLFWRMEGYSPSPLTDPQRYFKDAGRYSEVSSPVLLGDKYYRGADGRKTNIPMIRLAEMYLTRSIIRFQDDRQGAADDLNEVRARAWDADSAGIDYASSDFHVTADNITKDMIHAERIKELVFEGDRLSYLQALQKPIGPGDRDETYQNRTINSPYTNFYWPISQVETSYIQAQKQ